MELLVDRNNIYKEIYHEPHEYRITAIGKSGVRYAVYPLSSC